MHPCCLNYKDKWFYSQTGLLSPAHTVKNRAIHLIPSSASHCLFHFLTHGECRTRTLTTVSKYTLIVSFSFNEHKDTCGWNTLCCPGCRDGSLICTHISEFVTVWVLQLLIYTSSRTHLWFLVCSRPLYVTVVYQGKYSHCMRIGVAVPLNSTVYHLRDAVTRETKIPMDQVLFQSLNRAQSLP